MKRMTILLGTMAVVAAMFAECSKPTGGETKVTKPTFTVTTDLISVQLEGGRFSFTYSIANPADDGVLGCEASVEWITDFDFTVDGEISFSVSDNTGGARRSGNITACYSYSGGSLYQTVNVTQSEDEVTYVTAATAFGQYFGDINASDDRRETYQHIVCMSESEFEADGWELPDGVIAYIFDFWTSIRPDDAIRLPAGTYIAGEREYDGVFSDRSMISVGYDGKDRDITYLCNGNVEVSYEGDVCKIVATVTDNDRNEHNVMFRGTLIFSDETLMSSLERDYDAGDISNDVNCEVWFLGGSNRYPEINIWTFELYASSKTGFEILLCSETAFASGDVIPVGTFNASDTVSNGTFLTGSVDEGDWEGTWLLSDTGQYLRKKPYAAIKDGSISVSETDGGRYSIELNGYDSLGHMIAGTWTGVPKVLDMRDY